MAKIRYAMCPPCCPCLDKANEAVWGAPSSAVARFNQPYAPGEPILDDDYKAREYWMNAYVRCIEECGGGGASRCPRNCAPDAKQRFIRKDDPGYPAGTLRRFCNPEAPDDRRPPERGWLLIRVLGEGRRPLPQADVQIIDRLIHVLTRDDGAVRIEVPPGRSYPVHAWKDEYTEEVKRTDVVRPSMDTLCEITLRPQPSGILPVYVLDQDDRPVAHAKVTATPVRRTPGSYRPVRGTTEPAGLCHFYRMRYNTYDATAYKDGSMSDTRRGVVSRPSFNDRITLKIDLRRKVVKQFEIQLDRGRWLSGDYHGAAAVFANLIFTIRDTDTGRTARYATEPVFQGASVPLPWPVDGGYTTGEGDWTTFDAPRYVGATLMDETRFGGTTAITMAQFQLIVEIVSTRFTILFSSIRDPRRNARLQVASIRAGPTTGIPVGGTWATCLSVPFTLRRAL